MTISIVNCTKAVDSQLYINASSCFDGVEFSNFSSTRRRLYAMVDANVSNVETACTIEHTAMIPRWADGDDLRSYTQIYEQMVYGFELSWFQKAYDLVTYLYYIVLSFEVIPSYGIGLICDKLNLSCRIRINVYLLHVMFFLLGIGNIATVISV
ncbi:hypothetical protein NL676_000479 [Syzygium grande]|nr:hypothetical protein NL676_000479 [Syzygium grande]